MPGKSSSYPPVYWHSFVLRVWCETAVSPQRWRVTVRHISSNDWLIFATLNEAFTFIETHTATHPVINDDG